MKPRMLNYYMDIAIRTSYLSHAKKKKVGAILVKENRIISIGYNGMPSGWNNDCENVIRNEGVMFEVQEEDHHIYCSLETKPEVLHAEANAIAKVARSSESCLGASLFVTCTPCMECAKLIYQCGIDKVYYNVDYVASKGSGKVFLNQCGIHVEKIQ